MNPRTRRAALYAIGLIALLASANALAHSYAGLYDWAVNHQLSGWQARSWPAEIDVFLAVGELALYVAYLDGWPRRQRVWPWATALTGLVVSVAGNIGHIQAEPGNPAVLTDRLTAATSPLAAFAGLSVGLLVLKMTRQRRLGATVEPRVAPVLVLAAPAPATTSPRPEGGPVVPGDVVSQPGGQVTVAWLGNAAGQHSSGLDARAGLLRDARAIYTEAGAHGQRVSQRTLARQLRRRGHRFGNERLRWIAQTISQAGTRAA
jgi:hypothetical protein